MQPIFGKWNIHTKGEDFNLSSFWSTYGNLLPNWKKYAYWQKYTLPEIYCRVRKTDFNLTK